MSPRLKSALTFGGSLVLGGGLLYLALRSVDFSAVSDTLHSAAYGWLVPLLVITLAAHALRAWRWRLLLDVLPDRALPDGDDFAEPDDAGTSRKPRATTLQAFYATMIGYMVNQAAPRLGEPARAANLAAQTRHGFPAIFGTVVVERVIDVASLVVAVLSVGVLFWDQLGGLLAEFGAGARAIGDGVRAQGPLLAGLGVLVLLVGAGVLRWWMRRPASDRPGRIAMLAYGFLDGLRSSLQVRNRVGLLASTVGIWLGYAVMTYIPLHMLGLTEAYDVTMLDAWALVTLGAIGMALPSPGGTGSYHYAAIVTLTLLLGVPETPAASYALLTHAVQLVFMVVVGLLCLAAQGSGLRGLSATPPRSKPSLAPAPLERP